jgi:succinate dehydrogenase / fumarate reductase, cytochrome b subunit
VIDFIRVIRLMSPLRQFLSSSIGTKILIALTGLAFFGYLIVHLAGNLMIFMGAEAFNAYAHTLTGIVLLPIIEIGLAAIFLLHVYKAAANFFGNSRARPARYREKHWAHHTSRKTLSSTTMIVTGSIILIFTILHVMQFRLGVYYEDTAHHYRDLHRVVVELFANPVWVAFYVLSMGLVGMHLRHGLSSAAQSLGLEHPRYSRLARVVGLWLAVVIAGGFAVIPIWIYLTGGRS